LPLIVVVLAAAAAAAAVVLGAEIAPTSGFKVAMAPVAMLSLARSLVGCLLSSISFFQIFYPQMPLDTSANCAFSPAGSFFFLLHFPNTLRCGFLSL
jgi:hypothetical protein